MRASVGTSLTGISGHVRSAARAISLGMNRSARHSPAIRGFAVLLLAVMSPHRSLAAQQATVVRNVNLRPIPSTAQDPIRLLLPPEVLTLIDTAQSAGYYHVRTLQNEIGWVWAKNVSVAAGVAPASDPPGPPLPPPGSFAGDAAGCPAVGTHIVNGSATPFSDTSDGGLRNLAKRHIPVGAAPKTLDLFAFHMLQDDVNSRFADAHTTKTQFHGSRSDLLNRPTPDGTVSEGDLVQIAAYLIEVRSQGAESVNCAGTDGTDIHLSVGAKNSTEWKGVVVEMIPQLERPVGWDAATLRKVRDAKAEVLVVGGLTYDNEHLVNDDASHPSGTQPKRFSLWEIHPITEFYVCPAVTCDPANHAEWITLTAWAKSHTP
jgi:uncharacterized protein YgiM (DUF1202 family)